MENELEQIQTKNYFWRSKKFLTIGVGMVLLFIPSLILVSIIQKKQRAPISKDNSQPQIMQATCSWSSEPDTLSYNYTVINTKTQKIIDKGTVSGADNSITFQSVLNNTYSCEIEAVKKCK